MTYSKLSIKLRRNKDRLIQEQHQTRLLCSDKERKKKQKKEIERMNLYMEAGRVVLVGV